MPRLNKRVEHYALVLRKSSKPILGCTLRKTITIGLVWTVSNISNYWVNGLLCLFIGLIQGVHMSKLYKIVVIVSTLCSSINTFAQANCADVTDASQRLACFDALQKSNVKKSPKVSNSALQKLELEAQKNVLAVAEAEKFKAEQERQKMADAAAEAEKIKVEQEAKRKAEDERSRMLDATKEAKDALRALQKLDTRVSTGISFRDYPSVLSDAKFEVANFARSRSAILLPKFINAADDAITNYADAYAVWRQQFEHSYNKGKYVTLSVWDAGMVAQLLQKYPETIAFKNGVALLLEPTRSIVWSAAGDNTRKAQRELDEYLNTLK
jgi:hypothetical protein